MKNVVLMIIGGAALFVGTSVGLLAVQGRLNYQGTRGVPLISTFFADGASGNGSAEGDGGKAGQAELGGRVPPAAHDTEGAEHQAEPRVGDLGRESALPRERGPSVRRDGAKPEGPVEVPDGVEPAKKDEHAGESDATEHEKNVREGLMGQGQYERGRLFQFPQLESGLSVDELDGILASVKHLETELERRQAALEQHEAELRARENDVEERHKRVQEMMRQVTQARTDLDQEVARFERAHTLVRAGEADGIKKNAATLASLDSQQSAEVLRAWWGEGEAGKTKVVKLLLLMPAEAKQEILSALTAEEAREILDRLGKAVIEPKDGK